jgi:hypothetical protein
MRWCLKHLEKLEAKKCLYLTKTSLFLLSEIHSFAMSLNMDSNLHFFFSSFNFCLAQENTKDLFWNWPQVFRGKRLYLKRLTIFLLLLFLKSHNSMEEREKMWQFIFHLTQFIICLFWRIIFWDICYLVGFKTEVIPICFIPYYLLPLSHYLLNNSKLNGT